MLINLGTEEKPVYVEPLSVVGAYRTISSQGFLITAIIVLNGDDCHVDTPLVEVLERVNAAKIEHERQAFWDECCAATMLYNASGYDYDEADYCAKIATLKLQERNAVTGFKAP